MLGWGSNRLSMFRSGSVSISAAIAIIPSREGA